MNDVFAYIRGSFPHEIAPEVDYDEQFMKSILSPINSIIEPLGMPEITKRLSVVMDIFSSFGKKDKGEDLSHDEIRGSTSSSDDFWN
jgi:hypothetical protein